MAIRIFDGFQCLRITMTSTAGVFVVRDAWAPWLRRASDQEKTQLVHRFSRSFGSCVVWLDSRFEAIASAAPAASERLSGLNSDDWCGWFRADESLLLSIASCQEGGWGFFFFSSTSNSKMLPISPLPTEPEMLAKLLRELGAEAAVVSEIDDIYWLVSFNTKLCS